MKEVCKICGLKVIDRQQLSSRYIQYPDSIFKLCRKHAKRAHHVFRVKRGYEYDMTDEDVASYVCILLEVQVRKKQNNEITGFCEALTCGKDACHHYPTNYYNGKRVCNLHYKVCTRGGNVQFRNTSEPLIDLVHQHLQAAS